jgi:hypothetical protein
MRAVHVVYRITSGMVREVRGARIVSGVTVT